MYTRYYFSNSDLRLGRHADAASSSACTFLVTIEQNNRNIRGEQTRIRILGLTSESVRDACDNVHCSPGAYVYIHIYYTTAALARVVRSKHLIYCNMRRVRRVATTPTEKRILLFNRARVNGSIGARGAKPTRAGRARKKLA